MTVKLGLLLCEGASAWADMPGVWEAKVNACIQVRGRDGLNLVPMHFVVVFSI